MRMRELRMDIHSTDVCYWVVGVCIVKVAGQLLSQQRAYSAAAHASLCVLW
jgi:hypothetical protein